MVDVNTIFFNQHRFNLSWDGSEYQLIKNSTGEALETTYEHFEGALGRYGDRPIAIAASGHVTDSKQSLETEIYNWISGEWETKTEWKLDFITKKYKGRTLLSSFPVISFEEYVVIFGGSFGKFAGSDIIGLIFPIDNSNPFNYKTINF